MNTFANKWRSNFGEETSSRVTVLNAKEISSVWIDWLTISTWTNIHTRKITQPVAWEPNTAESFCTMIISRRCPWAFLKNGLIASFVGRSKSSCSVSETKVVAISLNYQPLSYEMFSYDLWKSSLFMIKKSWTFLEIQPQLCCVFLNHILQHL